MYRLFLLCALTLAPLSPALAAASSPTQPARAAALRPLDEWILLAKKKVQGEWVYYWENVETGEIVPTPGPPPIG